MSVIKGFKPDDIKLGDMIIREIPPLSWLVLEAKSCGVNKTRLLFLDMNTKGAPPFEIITTTNFMYPLNFKLLRKDDT